MEKNNSINNSSNKNLETKKTVIRGKNEKFLEKINEESTSKAKNDEKLKNLRGEL